MYKDILNDKLVLSVFLDLSKAFDTVDHEILIYKLEHAGVSFLAIKLLKSYLSCRKLVAYTDKSICSSMKTIKLGVPQGSILGPLFYILYVNDLIHAMSSSSMHLYADDTVLSSSSVDLQVCVRSLEHTLERVEAWFNANYLKVNQSKSKAIIFRKRTVQSHPCLQNIHIKFINDCIHPEKK